MLEQILAEVALNTPFKEIKLYFRKSGGPWIERAPLRIFNKEPYYDVPLLRYFSDANTIDCAEEMELGLQVSPGASNQLSSADKILVWGTAVEEKKKMI